MRKSELIVGEEYAFGPESYPFVGFYVGEGFGQVYSGTMWMRPHTSHVTQAVFAVKSYDRDWSETDGSPTLREQRWEPKVVSFQKVWMSKRDHEAAEAAKAARKKSDESRLQSHQADITTINTLLGIKAHLDYDYQHGRERGVLLQYDDFMKIAQTARKFSGRK